MLYLNAAMAAGGAKAAGRLVDEAADVAEKQGQDSNEDWTMFGPTNVDLYRVDMLVRFEDGWTALDVATGLDRGKVAGMTRERRAGHHITKARAALLTRRKEQAAEQLLEADQLAPEEVESRPDAVRLVKDVVGATPRPGVQLRALAQRCGLRA